MHELTVRKMEPEDVEEVVFTHLESFEGFFLSFLGTRFLNLYYSKMQSSAECLAFVCPGEKSEVLGFIAGTINPRGFYSRLLKQHWFRFSLAATGAIFRKPGVIPRIARAVLHPGKSPSGDNVVGLFSIGVRPGLQGSGIGGKLVGRFVEEAASRGCKRIILATDRDNNENTNNFYRRMNFVLKREYATPEGRRMNEYWLEI